MATTKPPVAILITLIPAVALVALEERATFFISNWDLRVGALEAPLLERIVVASYNWMVRLAPFGVIAVFLAGPLWVVFGGRQLAKAADAHTLRADSLLWSLFGMVIFLTAGFVVLPALRVGLVAPAMAFQWLGICFWAIAAANTYALLAVSGCRRPGVVVFMASLLNGPFGVFLFTAAFWAWSRRTRFQAGGGQPHAADEARLE